MTPLKIALVMVEPPLPFGNAAARWYYVLLKGLVDRGHTVTAFATCSNPRDISEAAALFPSPKYNLRCYAHSNRWGLSSKWQTLRRPYSYMFSDEMQRDVDATVAAGVDVLHLEQLWAGWMGLKHREIALVNTHYLFSIDQPLHATRGWYDRFMARLTRRAERRLLRAFDHHLALTPQLADTIKKVNPAAAVTVVPLAIDFSLYPFDPNPPRAAGAAPTVGLIGSFNWTPSVLAARRLIERLWPAIREKCPSARLLIVGRSAEAALGHYRNVTPGLELRSDVPDPIPHLREMDVMLYAPEAGSGIKVKIVEAMALGVAVVTNRHGMEGLDVGDQNSAAADNDNALAAAAVELLLDVARRATVSRSNRDKIERACSANTAIDRLMPAYVQRVNHTSRRNSHMFQTAPAGAR
jgi:glycosyltransferase involved in cell wall biosynthesis